MATYDVFARYYDALTTNVDYGARAAYFNSLIKEYIGEQCMLLDLACGTGRLSVEMAKLGHVAIGVDASPEMLSVAMQRAYEAGVDILFLNQAMTSLDLYGDIDVALCVLDSLNHLPDVKALDRTAERVALFLRPGGLFIFDLNTPYKHREVLADNCYVYETGEVYCVWQNETRGDATRITLDFFVPAGTGYNRYTEQFDERAFEDEAVREVMERAGLEVLAIYDEDSRRPPRSNSERLIYLTRKV